MSPPEVKSGHRCDHRSSDPRLQDRRGHLAASWIGVEEPQFYEKLAGQSAITPRRCLYASPLIG